MRARYQRTRLRIFRPVQYKVCALAALSIETHIVKHAGIQAAFINAGQKLLRHDLIGIQVGQRQGSSQAGYTVVGTHTISCFEKARTSLMTPVMDAAAAMAGLIR